MEGIYTYFQTVLNFSAKNNWSISLKKSAMILLAPQCGQNWALARTLNDLTVQA
jgi:hypothetical protein